MNGITTETYPTRYVAFENPETWIEASDFSVRRGGYEYAVYHEPMVNLEYPHLVDGIYCQIVSYQGIDFMADCFYTVPDKSRKQAGIARRFDDYHQARKFAQNWIVLAQQAIKESLATVVIS